MTAVESQPAMVRMGVCIQDALASEATASHNDDLSHNGGRLFTVPSIRWLRNLPAASSCSSRTRDVNGRRPPPSAGSQHSLVISMHALTRIPTHAERMRVVRDLWSRVEAGGALVLVEPGSPVGSVPVHCVCAEICRL
jgi:ribosomal protein RSM22 (predicted rRNA methylase)